MNKTNSQPIYQNMIDQPLAPLTLRIGVIGQKELTHAEVIRHSLKQIYQSIDKLTQQLTHHTIAEKIYSSEEKVIRFISSLNEGADRLCIEETLIPFKHEIAAILPFNTSAYAKDFSPEKSVIDKKNGTESVFTNYLTRINNQSKHQKQIIELDGDPRNRQQAYQQANRSLVEHCDILIAIYDKDDDANEDIAAAIHCALEQGLPVIHISTDNPPNISIYSSVLFGETSKAQPFSDDILLSELERLLLFTDIIKDNAITLDRFTRYIKEDNLQYQETSSDVDDSGHIHLTKNYPNFAAGIFSVFKRLLSRGDKVDTLVEKLSFSAPSEPSAHSDYPQQHPSISSHHFYATFLRADRLATYYANIHRSTFLLIYILGACALITAALALLFKSAYTLGFVFVLLELVLLSTIYYLYQKDHHNNYHGRWLEYRCLAEFLRPMVYLNRLGKSYQLHDLRNTADYLGREVIGHKNSARSWLYIYTQTMVRWIGFSHSNLTDTYKFETKNFINNTWIKDQITYHTHNAAKMQVLASRLGAWSFNLFFFTLAAVLLKLTLIGIKFTLPDAYYAIPSAVVYIVSLCTAIFPILATTAFAIRNHAEFDISAQRSLTTRAYLINQYQKMMKHSSTTNNEVLCQQLQDIAEETMDEAMEWLEIYEVKEAEPA